MKSFAIFIRETKIMRFAYCLGTTLRSVRLVELDQVLGLAVKNAMGAVLNEKVKR